MRIFQKRLLGVALVGLAMPVLSAAPLVGQDVTTGLVGHWTFDDESLDESSGFQEDGVHDGVAVGTIAYTDDTPAGGFALDMSASGTELAPVDSFVQVLNSNMIVGGGTGDGVQNETYQATFDPPELGNGFSIAFWGRGTPSRWAAFVSKNGEGNRAGFGYQVRRRASDARTTFTLRSTDGADDPAFDNADTLDTTDDGVDMNEWHHYTATWTAGENGFRNYYIDGVLIGTEVDWIEGQVDDMGLAINPDNSWSSARNEFLTFGGRDSDGVFSDSGALFMDDIRIYNRPLDAAAAVVLATPVDDVVVLLGDVNLDEAVSFSDISPFIAVLASNGFQAEADIDGSGVVDFADISPFISILASGT